LNLDTDTYHQLLKDLKMFAIKVLSEWKRFETLNDLFN